ncbi:MAG TPA: potassium channel family protein [Gaiellaceae bacterium]|jgi:voltage-gated potassium channel Kch|nr:potassium channel family protein [Gaiellaceae bacterium]
MRAPAASLIERRFSKLLAKPPTVRAAAWTIVVVTFLVVLAAGILMTVFDRSEYPNIWVAWWWAIETVTTVGYGDVTPKHVTGRIIASFVMLEGIAILAIVTAAITSTFVNRAGRELRSRGAAGLDSDLHSRLDELDRKLDLIQASLGESPRR